MKLAAGILVLLAARVPVAAAPAPVVYADDGITIRAAVAEAGSTAIHLGDPLTLIVEAVFDPEEVQIESLDGDWFRRAFADSAAFSLYRTGKPVSSPAGRGDVRLTMQWQFQVVGCPPDTGHCPGAKRYELPLAGVAYRLVSASEPGAASRAARFKPWPGSLAVVPSIRFDPEGDTGIGAVIAGGAWPAPEEPERTGVAASTAMLALGGILLGAGFVAGKRRRPAPRISQVHRNSRWERAVRQLEGGTLEDAAWSDLFRRCLTWYCLDELGRNPCEWLHADAGPTPDAHMNECRKLFNEILGETGVETDRRGALLERFARATGGRIL